MDNTTQKKKIKIILHVRPNPEVCVSKDSPAILGQFTVFPKFPLEIRTSIWRLSFPRGRKINVYKNEKDDDDESDDDEDELERNRFKSSNPHPVTFLVSRESRNISLKHYRVLLQHPTNEQLKSYFHPALDTIAFPDLRPLDEGLRLKDLTPELSELFGKIQSLELHNMWWSDIRTAAIGPQGRHSPPRWSDAETQRTRDNVLAGCFRGLHELLLAPEGRPVKRNIDQHDLNTADGQRECKEVLLYYFEEKNKVDKGFMVPEIRFIEPVVPKKKVVKSREEERAAEGRRARANLRQHARRRALARRHPRN
jgi:hypothetical protein